MFVFRSAQNKDVCRKTIENHRHLDVTYYLKVHYVHFKLASFTLLEITQLLPVLTKIEKS